MARTGRRGPGLLVILVLAGFSTVAMAGCSNPVMPIVKALTARPDGSAVADPAPAKSVRYEGNGHTEGSVPVDGLEYEDGEEVTVLGNTGSLVRSGHSFEGWNTEADGSSTVYADGASFTMGTAEVVLYAQWALVGWQIVAWGRNAEGESVAPAPNEGFVALAAGDGPFSLGLKE